MLGLAADAFFWGTHAGAELDLLLMHLGRRYGIEFKYGDAPTMAKSLHVALPDLKLGRARIVYPGGESYAAHAKGRGPGAASSSRSTGLPGLAWEGGESGQA